jgi:prepilin signal peptidase PulO-like enzyme (type II secretory pathway)
VVLGQAVMGYGDIFIAAALGAVLASSWPTQRRAAVVSGGLALVFDLLFLAVPELPATVPIAAALIVVECWGRGAAIKLVGVRRLRGTGG